MEDSAHRPIVLVADQTFSDPNRVRQHFGARAVIRFGDLGTPAAATAASEQADALVVATQPLSADILRALSPTVRVIGRTGVGLDSVDLPTSEQLGIAVVNQPAYGATEVASHAITLMLLLQRKILSENQFVRSGWQGGLSLSPMRPLDEITLGLLGCGRIGAETARLASAIVGRTVAYDPYAVALPEGVGRVGSLAELLAASDVLSIHSPLTADTRGLLGAAELALLPPGAIVLNVARGGILDEAALAALLDSGHLGGAGLDVFAGEPLTRDSPLLQTPNTVLTPHVAAYSDRSTWRLASWTLDDVLSWLDHRAIEHGNVAVAGRR